MLASVFKKSTFLSNSFIVLMLFVFYFIHLIKASNTGVWSKGIVFQMITLLVILASFFLVDFVIKKNGLSKNSVYPVLIYLSLLLLVPDVFQNQKLIFANFFILLAMRRMISLQTLNTPKEKIFDASLWVFAASLFHFWCILFIILVYASIIFHVSRDFRNWLLPFIAFVASVVVFVLLSLIFDKTWIGNLLLQTQIKFEINYFTNKIQNIVLSLISVIGIYFLFTMIFSVTSKPLILQASFKKMIFTFLIGVTIFLISPNKNNELLIFTFLPISVMATSNIEGSRNFWYQEITLGLIAFIGVFCFFSQL